MHQLSLTSYVQVGEALFRSSAVNTGTESDLELGYVSCLRAGLSAVGRRDVRVPGQKQ